MAGEKETEARTGGVTWSQSHGVWRIWATRPVSRPALHHGFARPLSDFQTTAQEIRFEGRRQHFLNGQSQGLSSLTELVPTDQQCRGVASGPLASEPLGVSKPQIPGPYPALGGGSHRGRPEDLRCHSPFAPEVSAAGAGTGPASPSSETRLGPASVGPHAPRGAGGCRHPQRERVCSF